MNRNIQVRDSSDNYYRKILISYMDSPNYRLNPHEKTTSGLIKLLIENGHQILDDIRRKESVSLIDES